MPVDEEIDQILGCLAASYHAVVKDGNISGKARKSCLLYEEIDQILGCLVASNHAVVKDGHISGNARKSCLLYEEIDQIHGCLAASYHAVVEEEPHPCVALFGMTLQSI